MAEQLYVARVTANALAAGRFVALVAGEPVDLSPEEADELLRIRFVVKAARGGQAADDREADADVVQVETAAVAPSEAATAPAQNARARKGSIA